MEKEIHRRLPKEPNFYDRWFPEADLPGAQAIEAALNRIASYTQEVADSIYLYQYLESLRPDFKARYGRWGPLGAWQFVAARGALVSLYNLSVAFEAVPPLMRDCETLRNRVDHSALRAVRREFTKLFPEANNLRHSVAHAAEMWTSPQKSADNAHTIPSEGDGILAGPLGENVTVRMVGISIGDGVAHSAFEGKRLEFPLTEATVDELEKLVSAYFALFPDLAQIRSDTLP